MSVALRKITPTPGHYSQNFANLITRIAIRYLCTQLDAEVEFGDMGADTKNSIPFWIENSFSNEP